MSTTADFGYRNLYRVLDETIRYVEEDKDTTMPAAERVAWFVAALAAHFDVEIITVVAGDDPEHAARRAMRLARTALGNANAVPEAETYEVAVDLLANVLSRHAEPGRAARWAILRLGARFGVDVAGSR